MKAIVQYRYGDEGVLRFEEVEEPAPTADQVKVEVRAAGVDAGVGHWMTGEPFVARPMLGWRVPKPEIRGSEMSGVVVEIGSAVTEFAVGDEIYGVGSGTFAEYTLSNPSAIARKPIGLSFADAAAFPISASTALQALRDKAEVRSGERVLVIGAGGGVGSFAVQIARRLGAEVTGVCSSSKVETVRGLGADRVLDYTKVDPTDLDDQYDAIIDIAGNRGLSSLRRITTKSGRLVLVGGEGGGRIFGATTRLMAAMAVNPFVPQRISFLIATENRADLEALGEMVEGGALRPLIAGTYPLSDAAEAIRRQRQGHTLGKYVITINEETIE